MAAKGGSATGVVFKKLISKSECKLGNAYLVGII